MELPPPGSGKASAVQEAPIAPVSTLRLSHLTTESVLLAAPVEVKIYPVKGVCPLVPEPRPAWKQTSRTSRESHVETFGTVRRRRAVLRGWGPPETNASSLAMALPWCGA